MEYYNQLLEIVHNNIGQPIADLLTLEKTQSLYVSHAIILFVGALLLLQVLSSLIPSATHSPSMPSGSKKQTNVQTAKSSKRGKKNFLLICGPTNSGKTGLFYHLLTRQARMTVSSTEANQSNGPMEVKIPSNQGEALTKKINVIDIPGHYHFKEKLNQSLDDSRAVILVIDSKEK